MQPVIQIPKVNIPVIKAWGRIFDLLECVYDHPYDRKGFQEAVLVLYGKEKSSKSVFRGMAIPTLRNLGFIVGYGDVIQISADGALVYTSNKKNNEQGLRALRTILVERDQEIGVLSYLLEDTVFTLDEFLYKWMKNISISDKRTLDKPQSQLRAARERLLDWINFLAFTELIYNDHQNIKIDSKYLEDAKTDLNPYSREKSDRFKSILFSNYKKIVFKQGGIGTIEIEELRKEMALSMSKELNILLTEKQFDVLLSEFPKMTEEYTITFGRSMGADEKLFVYQGKYYQTLLVRFL
jgi:hypothetical protein